MVHFPARTFEILPWPLSQSKMVFVISLKSSLDLVDIIIPVIIIMIIKDVLFGPNLPSFCLSI